jgi:hypothetical protein
MTVTATWAGSGTTSGKGVKPTTFLGTLTTAATAVVSQGGGTSGTNNFSPTYNNTVDQSVGMGVGTEWNQLGTPTSTDTEQGFDIAGAISGLSVFKASPTSGTGVSVALNMDAGGSGAALWAYKLWEIIPSGGAAANPKAPWIVAPSWAVQRSVNY